MIPRLGAEHGIDPTTRVLLDALGKSAFSGEIRTDLASRVVAATDNSVYQVLPSAVVLPRSGDDVALLLSLGNEERFRSVRLSPRGGGTGTNGQSLSAGVVIDLSKHLNRVLEINLVDGWVRVEPGVVLDQLNALLESHGVFFAPSLSPSSRATLGGMISTDACGKGSRVYGRTSNHVLELSVVLSDGTRWTSKPLPPDELSRVAARDDIVGRVHRVVSSIVTEKADLIARTFPKLERFMTGYNLAMVRDPGAGTFDLNPLLAGSEGTLAVVTEARLRLTPLPVRTELVLLKYASFEDALASARALVERNPSAIETIDETVLGLAREDIIFHRVRHMLAEEGDRPVRTVNLVELAGANPAEIGRKTQALLEDSRGQVGRPGGPTGVYHAAGPDEARALWELRKKGVGLLGAARGDRRPSPFIEDTVVPPERLPEYVRDLRALLDEAGLTYGMFGHIDVGCLHVRPALDLKDPRDEQLLRRLSDQVCDLVARYGGVMWGEHGKGFRSEYNPRFFGPELYTELCRVKEAFDPYNRLNPGKLATPLHGTEALVSVDGPKRGAQDRQIAREQQAAYGVAIHCNGNGACFHYDADTVMCPSYKETRDRIHSPKGRAALLREWLRQLSVAGFTASRPEPASWLTAPLRWLARLARRAWGGYDFSHEVYKAMAGCLSCKACATQCPIKVDVPELKGGFLALYHERYPRPLSDLLVAALEGALPLLARLPRLANLALRSRAVAAVLSRFVGIVDAPPLAVPTLDQRLRARGRPAFDPREAAGMSPDERRRAVLVLQDAFTSFYEPDVVLAVVDLLSGLGYTPLVLPRVQSGKAFHVKGFQPRLRRAARRATALLGAWTELGIPIIGIDPAIVLALRDEIPRAAGLTEPTYRVHLLQEWLAAELRAAAPPRPPSSAEPFVLMGHCTERALVPESDSLWRDIFSALGLELRAESVGCCGMSGMYGHEATHQAESRGIFDKGWRRHIAEDASARERILATGYSCRSQVERYAAFTPRHPAQALARALGYATPPK